MRETQRQGYARRLSPVRPAFANYGTPREVFAGLPAVIECIVDLVAGSAFDAGREIVAMDRAMGSAEIGKRMLILSIVTPIALWAFGFPVSLVRGCDPGSAWPRATAFALSWLAGWLVYCGVLGWPRSREDLGVLVWGFAFTPGINLTMLEPKARPWPFAEMLRLGVPASAGFGLVMGLILRGWKHSRKRAATGRERISMPADPGR